MFQWKDFVLSCNYISQNLSFWAQVSLQVISFEVFGLFLQILDIF